MHPCMALPRQEKTNTFRRGQGIMDRQLARQAFLASIPVMAGYVILGVGFGILLRSAGYGAWWALAMSLFIYAGSMQYVGVGLVAGGAAVLAVILTLALIDI